MYNVFETEQVILLHCTAAFFTIQETIAVENSERNKTLKLYRNEVKSG